MKDTWKDVCNSTNAGVVDTSLFLDVIKHPWIISNLVKRLKQAKKSL